jgi:hypothetical protein
MKMLTLVSLTVFSLALVACDSKEEKARKAELDAKATKLDAAADATKKGADADAEAAKKEGAAKADALKKEADRVRDQKSN